MPTELERTCAWTDPTNGHANVISLAYTDEETGNPTTELIRVSMGVEQYTIPESHFVSGRRWGARAVNTDVTPEVFSDWTEVLQPYVEASEPGDPDPSPFSAFLDFVALANAEGAEVDILPHFPELTKLVGTSTLLTVSPSSSNEYLVGATSNKSTGTPHTIGMDIPDKDVVVIRSIFRNNATSSDNVNRRQGFFVGGAADDGGIYCTYHPNLREIGVWGSGVTEVFETPFSSDLTYKLHEVQWNRVNNSVRYRVYDSTDISAESPPILGEVTAPVPSKAGRHCGFMVQYTGTTYLVSGLLVNAYDL